ncbi:UspA domain-containing protein [Emticicia oligotrophica DSM 17448]|uniref:UspA domain-containing protein n=1 Tax=Emticicia oligotrophica (strain DSM 17448 / CIP 109782 / MTCC 6937 / GPTSA100-15) TaxID=929562 RepID=A0ABN4AEU8_EMTOG|nr:universal stress protein [Emticicia oligotrophica]AFK01529.1 UspA domain-containing protein [Emticicia oligotrophica DSM 17448]
MKTIVFATDFSRGSRKAAQVAAQTALKANAKLVLFHAYRYVMPYDSEMSMLAVSPKELEKHSIYMLKRLQKRLEKKYTTALNTEIIVEEGLVVDTLSQVIEKTNADLLVMGTVGDSLLGGRFFGSLATSMIHHSNAPILLVPPKAKYSSFNNAVLGLDFRFDLDEVLLEKAVFLLRDLDSVVNLYTLTDESEFAKAASLKVRQLLKNVPHTYTIVEGDNFVKSVLSFANTNHADLIITFPRKHNLLERIFVGSNTERLAFNDEIPILSIL